MANTPRISDAEWEIMKILWEKSPQGASEVVAALDGHRDWNPKTVKTLLTRLVKKGALSFEKDGRAYLYRPKVTERDCVAVASRSFVDRVFGGSILPMLAHLVESKSIAQDEIAELRRLLDEKSDKKR